jgi:hypothetical protein
VVEQSAACSLPSADIHTTVTHCNSLVQYNFAMAIYAEMRWLLLHFNNRWSHGALAT